MAGFDAQRLTLARWSAGLTKSQLAERIDVSPASITQYEAGRTTPPPLTLARIALVLGFPAEYFETIPDRRSPSTSGRSFFRSLRSTRQWERDQADATAEHLYDIVAFVERYVRLPSVELPQLPELPQDAGRSEIEQIAEELRASWGLAEGPVPHVVRLLEAHGVIVGRLPSRTPRLDAFSRWFDKRPVVILWDSKDDKARSRFDAAHELAHLIFHHEPELSDKTQERQAHAFASAFLMPAHSILESLPRRPPRGPTEWNQLFELRRRWGVSVAALLYRSRELGVLPDAGFRRAMTRLSELGLRHHDGEELGPPEQPALIGRAVGAMLAHRGWSLDDIGRELGLGERHLTELLGGDFRPDELRDETADLSVVRPILRQGPDSCIG